MRRPILSVLVGVVIAAPGTASDYPDREWGPVLSLDMTLAQATACVAREFDRGGGVTVIPVDGGNDINRTLFNTWPKMRPVQTFQVRESDGRSTLRVLYRRPSTKGRVTKDVEALKAKCLRLSSSERAPN